MYVCMFRNVSCNYRTTYNIILANSIDVCVLHSCTMTEAQGVQWRDCRGIIGRINDVCEVVDNEAFMPKKSNILTLICFEGFVRCGRDFVSDRMGRGMFQFCRSLAVLA